MTKLTPESCRAARATLDWSIKDLCEQSKVVPAAVNQLESGREISSEDSDKIISTFVEHDIEILTGNGVGARLIESGEKTPQKHFCVTIIDNFNKHDRNDRFEICGFESADQAMVYGLRRVWSSVEQFRKDDQTKEQLHYIWMAMGDEVNVDGVYIGFVNFDYFFQNPATAEERDYISLLPEQKDEL